MSEQIHNLMHSLQGFSKNRAVTVFNVNPFPVLVNQQGQMLGGRESATVNAWDPVLRKALDSGNLVEIEAEEPAVVEPQPKKRKKS